MSPSRFRVRNIRIGRISQSEDWKILPDDDLPAIRSSNLGQVLFVGNLVPRRTPPPVVYDQESRLCLVGYLRELGGRRMILRAVLEPVLHVRRPVVLRKRLMDEDVTFPTIGD